MEKVLIVDLWNGEGYSDSKAWFHRVANKAAAQKYLMESVLIACSGIDAVMNAIEDADAGFIEGEPGLFVKDDRIIYDMGEDQGSYHYKMIEKGENVFGVVLHPNVNEYTLITDADEWVETVKRFKQFAKDEDVDDYLGYCFDGAWDGNLDAILFDTEMLYDDEDKVFMLHQTSDLQESNSHTQYPTKDELMKAWREATDIDRDDYEIHADDEWHLYYEDREETHCIYWEVYYTF